MTPLRWGLLLILFTCYLLLGGTIFMVIEQHHELHQKEELHVLRQDIQEILIRLDRNFYDNSTNPDILDALTTAKEGVINRIAGVCQLDNLLEGPDSSVLRWNYYNSVFFAFTVVTTIGYGHLSPSTSIGKIMVIFFALFGIPLNGILLSGVGDYFSNKIIKVHQKSKDKKYRGKSLTLIFEVIFYLIPGIVVFLVIPAGMFVLIENWSFVDSFYYAFVTLTTVGFGDYVAGMGDGHNVWLWLYKVFLIVWITFGLGYLIMILGFIARGMKSKKVRGILDKRLSGIRNTKEKLSKDIDYMRRIVNELYMMKMKPAYEVNGDGDFDQAKDELDGGRGRVIFNSGVRSRRPSCLRFERRCSSLPGLLENNANERGKNGESDVTATSSQRKGILKRRLSDSELCKMRTNSLDDTGSNVGKDSLTREEEMMESVVAALDGNMDNVIKAVDELNRYEQEVEYQRDFGNDSTPEESGDDQEEPKGAPHSNSSPEDGNPKELKSSGAGWELRPVSESDEEDLLDEDKAKSKEQLERVVVHKTSKDERDGPSFMERVGEAIRKISGGGTPPETPSRKISRNESDTKRKISRNSEPGRSFRSYQHYSPFTRQPLALRSHSPAMESVPSGEGEIVPTCCRHNPRLSAEMRKISQESRLSTLSTASYQTIDEIIRSARGTRKNTPAQSEHGPHLLLPTPPPSSDQVDGHASGRISLESSTSSLVHFMKTLDSVQDRLKKTSGCSDASFSGSYHSNDVDLSNSYAPSSMAKVIAGHRLQRPVIPVQGVDRRRRHGIFQPGFSYVNFGYSGEEEEEEVEERRVSIGMVDGVVATGKLVASEDPDNTSTVRKTSDANPNICKKR